MHDQHLAVVEPGEQIFGPPVERLDLAPCQPLAEALGQRKAQIGAPLLHARERVAHEDGLQAPAHGLHFRQLWHGVPAYCSAEETSLQCNNSLNWGLRLLSASQCPKT